MTAAAVLRFRLRRALSVGLLAAFAPVAQSKSPTGTILVYGDSLSAEYGLARGTGWAALLQARLTERKLPFTVVNSSISGETTSGGASRIAAELAKHRPAIVVIELGGNDALRGLPLDLSKQNLAAMIEAATNINARVVLAGIQMPPNYGRAYTEQFKQLYSSLATQYKTALVPHFLEGIGEKRELFQADGIHPLASAHPIILANVWPALEPLLNTPPAKPKATKP